MNKTSKRKAVLYTRAAPDEYVDPDPGPYTPLQLLILNNTEDPERAEQEFRTHWSIRKPSGQ
jgi:hypothetical protein